MAVGVLRAVRAVHDGIHAKEGTVLTRLNVCLYTKMMNSVGPTCYSAYKRVGSATVIAACYQWKDLHLPEEGEAMFLNHVVMCAQQRYTEGVAAARESVNDK